MSGLVELLADAARAVLAAVAVVLVAGIVSALVGLVMYGALVALT